MSLPLSRASFTKMTESHTKALHTGWLIHRMAKVYFLGALTCPEKKKRKKTVMFSLLKSEFPMVRVGYKVPPTAPV